MGVLLSCCLKAGYDDLSTVGSFKGQRKETIKELIKDKKNPNVDGRRSNKGQSPYNNKKKKLSDDSRASSVSEDSFSGRKMKFQDEEAQYE